LRSDRDRLEDILEACRSVRRLVSPRLDNLADDEILRLATERLIEIIGEGTARVSAELRTRHPEVDWRGPTDMRTVVAHRYFDIDPDIVRRVVERDVPHLERQIESILEELE
jgi:uncharacterized protein with HEPN domain